VDGSGSIPTADYESLCGKAGSRARCGRGAVLFLNVNMRGPMFKNFIGSIQEFFSDVRGELKKVSFPTRAETIGSTTVVIVFCIIMSLYLSFVDSVLVWAVSKIL
jgi:preprotein translocase subunit SecE